MRLLLVWYISTKLGNKPSCSVNCILRVLTAVTGGHDTIKATMEDRETTSISVSEWWRSNRNYFKLRQGISCIYIKKYEIQPSNTNSIAKETVPTLTIDILSTSRWNTCQKREQSAIFVSWNYISVLSAAEYFRDAPIFLLRFTSAMRASSILAPSFWLPLWHSKVYSRSSFIRISIIRTLDYPNWASSKIIIYVH